MDSRFNDSERTREMKVKDLMAELAKCDPEAELIVQKDAEGNGYSPLSGIDHECVYMPECDWYGDVISTKWSPEECCMGHDPDHYDEIMAMPRCVVLYPIN